MQSHDLEAEAHRLNEEAQGRMRLPAWIAYILLIVSAVAYSWAAFR